MKPQSYLFLTVLLMVIFFLLGVRYGQKVEKTNKVIDYLLSLTPTRKLTTTPTPTPLSFEEYKSRRWGLRFKYPANFEIKESTNAPEVFLEPKQ